MAEEFADFIEELNKESLEEQVVELKAIVGRLVNITENFIKYYDMELGNLINKMIKLETNQMKGKLPKIEVIATPSSASSPNTRPLVNHNVRGDILGELKQLFKKKKENEQN